MDTGKESWGWMDWVLGGRSHTTTEAQSVYYIDLHREELKVEQGDRLLHTAENRQGLS